MNGHIIELWKFDPGVQCNAKVMFPREHIRPRWAWSLQYSMRLELKDAKL